MIPDSYPEYDHELNLAAESEFLRNYYERLIGLVEKMRSFLKNWPDNKADMRSAMLDFEQALYEWPQWELFDRPADEVAKKKSKIESHLSGLEAAISASPLDEHAAHNAVEGMLKILGEERGLAIAYPGGEL